MARAATKRKPAKRKAKAKPKNVAYREIPDGVITKAGTLPLMVRVEYLDGEPTVVSLGADRAHMAIRITGDATIGLTNILRELKVL